MKVSADEWRVAQARLKDAKNGAKLIKTANYRKHHWCVWRPYKIEHSFIKLQGTVYAIGPRVGNGMFASVKRLLDVNGNERVVKISGEGKPYAKEEQALLADLGLLVAYGERDRSIEKRNNSKAKHYIVMDNLGVSLRTYLRKHAISEHQRLELAISACLALDALHSGEQSKTNTHYAHHDIKPSNLLVDSHREIIIVDFGFTSVNDYKPVSVSCGSPPYVPYKRVLQHVSRDALDKLALKRTLYYPKAAQTSQGVLKRAALKEPWILTDKMMRKYGLHPYFDTGVNGKAYRNFLPPQESLKELAAILILARSGLMGRYKDMRLEDIDNIVLCYRRKLFDVVSHVLDNHALNTMLSRFKDKENKEKILWVFHVLGEEDFISSNDEKYISRLMTSTSNWQYKLLTVLARRGRLILFDMFNSHRKVSELLWKNRSDALIVDFIIYLFAFIKKTFQTEAKWKLTMSVLSALSSRRQWYALNKMIAWSLFDDVALVKSQAFANKLLLCTCYKKAITLIKAKRSGWLLSFTELQDNVLLSAIRRADMIQIKALQRLSRLGLRYFKSVILDREFCVKITDVDSDEKLKAYIASQRYHANESFVKLGISFFKAHRRYSLASKPSVRSSFNTEEAISDVFSRSVR